MQAACREVEVPLLAVIPSGSRAVGEYLRGLELNSRLGQDYFVIPADGVREDFLMKPSDAAGVDAVEQAVTLAAAWIDRYVPEGLGARRS